MFHKSVLQPLSNVRPTCGFPHLVHEMVQTRFELLHEFHAVKRLSDYLAGNHSSLGQFAQYLPLTLLWKLKPHSFWFVPSLWSVPPVVLRWVPMLATGCSSYHSAAGSLCFKKSLNLVWTNFRTSTPTTVPSLSNSGVGLNVGLLSSIPAL